MTSSHHDGSTGTTFMIPSAAPLAEAEARMIVDRWKEEERNQLFSQFKLLPENAGWTGDEAAKKEELLLAKLRSEGSITIQDVEPAAQSLDGHPPLTNEA